MRVPHGVMSHLGKRVSHLASVSLRVRSQLRTEYLRHSHALWRAGSEQVPGGCAFPAGQDDTLVILGSFRGQSALFGLLHWLHSLGAPLVSVRRLGEARTAEGGGER